MIRWLLSALLLALVASTAHARMLLSGGVANGSIPLQTIASINLSPTTFVATGGTVTVGTISVAMSPSSPPFAGSPPVLGTGPGCAGTDNAGFSVSGTTLQTTQGVGTYSIGLVATQSGIGNSPFCHEFTVTGSAPSANSAQVIGLDTSSTQGSWVGTYGTEGYAIAGGASSTPSYATVSLPSGTVGPFSSAPPTCPENPDLSACNSISFWNGSGYDIHITDGRPHRLSLYAYDLFNNGQINHMVLTDGDTSATLATINLTSMSIPGYQTFLISGHVILAPVGAIAIFFDPPAPALGWIDYAIASSGGGAVPLNITAPVEPGASLTASVTALPSNGTVTLADGTPVTVSESLSLAQLAGLKVAPATLSTTAASSFSYTVSDGSHSSTGNVPISVEVVPTPPTVSTCAATGYEQAGSVTSDSGLMSVLVPTSGITPSETGVMVNDSNVTSIITAHYFVAKHGIPPGNVFHFSYPFIQSELANYTMDQGTFNSMLALVPSNIQMLALAFNEPFEQTNGSFAGTLGSSFFYSTPYPPTSGSPTQPGWTGGGPVGSNYWLSQPVTSEGTNLTAQSGTYPATATPFTDLGNRPTSFVAGFTLAQALALVDKGAAAQTIMPTGTSYFVQTNNNVAYVRAYDAGATVGYWNASGAYTSICKYNDTYNGRYPGCVTSDSGDFITNTNNVMTLQGRYGNAPIPLMATNTYVPGSEADLLTSSAGGLLPESGPGEGSILSLLKDGATGSYGWVGEPLAQAARFPLESILTQQYFRGRTLGEAIWMSVQDPGSSEVVGDPLARPWGTTASYSSGTLTLRTSILPPSSTTTYSLKAASSCGGTYATLQSGIAPDPTYLKFKTITDSSGFHPFYKLTSP